LNKEALDLARQNLAERGLPEDMRRAAVSIMMIADSRIETEDTLSFYREAGELLEKAASMENNEKIFRNLAIVHNRIGTIAWRRGDFTAAAASYIEDLKISQRLAMETGKPQARYDFAVSCHKLAEVYRICGRKKAGMEYYKLARRTMEYLVKGRGQPDDFRGLIVLLNSSGKYMQTAGTGNLNEPMESYQRALTLGREMAAKYGLTRDYLYVAASLANIGIELFNTGDLTGAKEKWAEAQGLFEKYGAQEAEEMKQLISKCEE
jgi:tetratricopeptide (TPR) repeat protein